MFGVNRKHNPLFLLVPKSELLIAKDFISHLGTPSGVLFFAAIKLRRNLNP